MGFDSDFMGFTGRFCELMNGDKKHIPSGGIMGISP